MADHNNSLHHIVQIRSQIKFFLFRYAHCIESSQINAANRQYATEQSTSMLIPLYMLLNFKYITI